jgi:hypothetical protein
VRKELPDNSKEASSFSGVHCFRSADEQSRTRYKVLSLNRFPEAAIREILRLMWVGYNPGKTIAYVPLGSETGEAETMTSEELSHLSDIIEDEDMPAELDSRARRIKLSHTIAMIQKYTV